MQAQAAGGSGEGIQGLLQNPKVQIGVIAVGAIALIVVIYMLFFANNAAPAPTPMPSMGQADPGMSPDGVPLPPGGPGDAMAPGAPMVPGDPMMAGAGAPGMPGAPAASGAAAEDATKGKGPGVPTRKNPFGETDELKKVLDSIPLEKTPEFTALPHNIYVDELRKPKPLVQADDADENDGPPIPTMRVAGVVYGRQVSATLQIGEQYLQVTPGQMVPPSNPIYRVDRIEQETVHLSRRWEMGPKKGVQRIEVGLTARAATPGGGGFAGPGGYPGAGPGGYPGAYPGAGGVPAF